MKEQQNRDYFPFFSETFFREISFLFSSNSFILIECISIYLYSPSIVSSVECRYAIAALNRPWFIRQFSIMQVLVWLAFSRMAIATCPDWRRLCWRISMLVRNLLLFTEHLWVQMVFLIDSWLCPFVPCANWSHPFSVGMLKLVINNIDKLFVTSDTSTIVEEMEVVHPAAKMIVEAAQMQQKEVFLWNLKGDVLNVDWRWYQFRRFLRWRVAEEGKRLDWDGIGSIRHKFML